VQPFNVSQLDTTVHGPVRLGVLAALHVDGALDFTSLGKRLRVSDGALGMHLQKLEAVGYIASRKAFVGRRPRTTYRLSSQGRRAFAAYLDQMKGLLDAVRGTGARVGKTSRNG
jgi:predicted ArsR family transcriptional regulator